MSSDVLFDVQNNLGIITLNRPQALNALSDEMFLQIRNHLKAWEHDASIKAVLVKSNVEKAFCAGGDIRAIYESRNEPADIVSQYFRLEYEINHSIFHFPKPYIALLHGITMGGGVGLSIHGSHCISSENLKWAMPETLIGFFPDVGATYYLSRLPDFIGVYLALTGNSIDAQTALALKLVKKIVPYEKFSALEQQLIQTHFMSEDSGVVSKIINTFCSSICEKINLPVEKIAANFCFHSVEEIVEALNKNNDDWSRETLSQLQKRSPTSLKVAFHQLHLAKTKSLDEVIQMDIHIARTMLDHHDFFEGIRAAIIDKDKNPRWQPAELLAVSDFDVNKYF